MLIDVREYDVKSDSGFYSGALVSSDGTDLADWYFYESDGIGELWWDGEAAGNSKTGRSSSVKLFYDTLSARQLDFLEKQVRAAIFKITQQTEEVAKAAAGVTQ